MNEKNCNIKSNMLFAVWKCLFGIFAVCWSIYLTYAQAILGINIHKTPSAYYYVFSLACALVFIPFLFLIYQTAKNDGCSTICSKVRRLMWILGICAVGTFLANILSITPLNSL